MVKFSFHENKQHYSTGRLCSRVENSHAKFQELIKEEPPARDLISAVVHLPPVIAPSSGVQSSGPLPRCLYTRHRQSVSFLVDRAVHVHTHTPAGRNRHQHDHAAPEACHFEPTRTLLRSPEEYILDAIFKRGYSAIESLTLRSLPNSEDHFSDHHREQLEKNLALTSNLRSLRIQGLDFGPFVSPLAFTKSTVSAIRMHQLETLELTHVAFDAAGLTRALVCLQNSLKTVIIANVQL